MKFAIGTNIKSPIAPLYPAFENIFHQIMTARTMPTIPIRKIMRKALDKLLYTSARILAIALPFISACLSGKVICKACELAIEPRHSLHILNPLKKLDAIIA